MLGDSWEPSLCESSKWLRDVPSSLNRSTVSLISCEVFDVLKEWMRETCPSQILRQLLHAVACFCITLSRSVPVHELVRTVLTDLRTPCSGGFFHVVCPSPGLFFRLKVFLSLMRSLPGESQALNREAEIQCCFVSAVSILSTALVLTMVVTDAAG